MTTNNVSQAMILAGEVPANLPSLTEQFTNTAAVFYSSIQDDGSRATKTKIYNAMQEALPLADQVNKTLEITDIMAHNVDLCVDEETGEIATLTRVILIDKKGQAYAAISKGVMSSIQKIVGVVGPAPWTGEPVLLTPVTRRVRSGFTTLTLSMVAK